MYDVQQVYAVGALYAKQKVTLSPIDFAFGLMGRFAFDYKISRG